jgi:hypothetical protein
MSRLRRLNDTLPGRYPLESMPDKKAKAKFIEPMLLLRTEKLPEGPDWICELLCGGPHKSSSVASNVMWR